MMAPSVATNVNLLLDMEEVLEYREQDNTYARLDTQS